MVVRTLPEWIELRRDTMAAAWILTCRACGLRERWHVFWNASRAAHDHADMHLHEQDEQRTGGN